MKKIVVRFSNQRINKYDLNNTFNKNTVVLRRQRKMEKKRTTVLMAKQTKMANKITHKLLDYLCFFLLGYFITNIHKI